MEILIDLIFQDSNFILKAVCSMSDKPELFNAYRHLYIETNDKSNADFSRIVKFNMIIQRKKIRSLEDNIACRYAMHRCSEPQN